MSENIGLGPGREFDVIRELVRRWGPTARGIGDDAAVLDVPPGSRLVVSTDASVENVHFRSAWLTPKQIGFRATVAALSDLAAMAATPIGILVALTVPHEWQQNLVAIADGIGEAARTYDAPIRGGNLARGSELSLTITALGHSVQPIGRNGAHAGDHVYVTGTLGGPERAVLALEQHQAPTPEQRARFVRPSARIREALWLAAHGITAAIDISDGLMADAGHVASASGVDLCLELDAIPVMQGVSPMDAANGGEEYELLVTSSVPLDEHAFAHEFGVPITRVGVARPPEPTPSARLRARGAFVDLPAGHDHFSR